MDTTSRPLRVAVVGTGLAGLTATYLLEREASRRGVELDLHLFEKSSSLGFHSSSITIPPSLPKPSPSSAPSETDLFSLSPDDDIVLAKKQPWTVDVPMRSFQAGYYPHLLALYQSLLIPMTPVAFDYSFSHLKDTTVKARFLYQGSNGLAFPSLPSGVSALTSLGRLLAYAISYLYLLLLSVSYWLFGWPGGTVKNWTKKVGREVWGSWIGSRWEEFVEEILVVLFGAVGTCSDQDVAAMDVGLILEYIRLTLFTSHYTAPTSSSSISRALTASIPPSNIHLSTSISSLRRDLSTSTTSITYTSPCSPEPTTMKAFDEVILATQANQAKRLLDSLLESLKTNELASKEMGEVVSALDKFHYVATMVINHTSPSVLPSHSSDIKQLNLLRCPVPPSPSPLVATSRKIALPHLDHFPPSSLPLSPSYTQSTHVLHPPPTHLKTHGPVYQTTNPIMAIPVETVLSVAHLERALPTPLTTSLILPRLLPSHPSTLQGRSGIWLVGSYAWKGIPLLEGCVRSAEEVVKGEEGLLGRWGGRGGNGKARRGKEGW